MEFVGGHPEDWIPATIVFILMKSKISRLIFNENDFLVRNLSIFEKAGGLLNLKIIAFILKNN